MKSRTRHVTVVHGEVLGEPSAELREKLAGSAGSDRSDVLTLEVDLTHVEITLAVEDAIAGGVAEPRAASDGGATSLLIVSTLPDRWGIEKRGATTRTWARFAIPSQTDAVDDVGASVQQVVGLVESFRDERRCGPAPH